MIYFLCIVAQNQEGRASNLAKSLKRYNCNLTIISAYDFKLKNLSKIFKVSEYLQCNQYNDDDIIVLLDAFDVLCCGDPKRLPTYLKNKGIDILISSEDTFGLHPNISRQYYDEYSRLNGTRAKYINSGVYVGYANKIKLLFQGMVARFDELRKEIIDPLLPANSHILQSDQYFLTYYLHKIDFINNKKDFVIGIDVKDEITFTNTFTVNQQYKLSDYMFIHTWGLYNFSQLTKYRQLVAICCNPVNIANPVMDAIESGIGKKLGIPDFTRVIN
jgi:hypothetical protein